MNHPSSRAALRLFLAALAANLERKLKSPRRVKSPEVKVALDPKRFMGPMCQIFLPGILALTCWLGMPAAHAATHVWNGAGLTGNWSLPANWQANNPPVAGEAPPVIIYFATGAARLNSTNNIANLVVDSVFFQGNNFHMEGSGAGANITFIGGSGFTFGGTGDNNTLGASLTITLSNSVPFYLFNDLTINSRLIGPGGFTLDAFDGNGVLNLNCLSDNLFTGGVIVTNGNLQMQNGFSVFGTWYPSVAVPSALTVGGTNEALSPVVTVFADSQLGTNCALTLYPNAYFYLNGASNEIGSITMNGGTFYGNNATNANIGTLALRGNIAATFSPFLNNSISAKINLGGATRTIDVASNAVLYLSGPVSGSPGIIKTGLGALNLFAPNTYAGATTVNAGVLGVYDNNALGSVNAGTTVAAGAQVFLNLGVSSAEPLTLNGTGPNGSGALTGTGTNYWSGQITLASAATITVARTNCQIRLDGVMTGGGDLTKDGPGNLYMFGINANTYTGGTYVKAGTLSLNCGFIVPAIAVPGYLEIASGTNNAAVRWFADAQLPSTSTIQIDADPVSTHYSGTLDLNGHAQTCGPIFFQGGNVGLGVAQTGAGTLTLNGPVTVKNNSYGTIYGNLSLGGASQTFNLANELDIYAQISDGGSPAGFTVNGGTLTLHTNSTFSGWVTANGGYLSPYHNLAFGATNGGVILTNNATLSLSGNNFTNEPLVCAANSASVLYAYYTNTWSGPIQVQGSLSTYLSATDYLFNLSGVISGNGAMLTTGTGLVRLIGTNANTFTGLLSAYCNLDLARTNATAVAGPLAVYPASTVRLRTGSQILDTVPVVVYGKLDLNNFSDTVGDFSGSGTLSLGSGQLLVGGTNAVNTFSGPIIGSGGAFTKFGTNTMVLSGNSPAFTGLLYDGGGTLLVNGQMPGADAFVFSGATLGGNGSFGNLYAQNPSIISPGSGNTPGKLNCSNATFNTASVLNIKLQGLVAGTGYDQLNVAGTVTLNAGASLNVNKTFTGAVSNQFTIVNNDQADAVVGIFNNLPNNTNFLAGTTPFQINYSSVFGNDIVLTQLGVNAASQFGGVTALGNGTMQLTGTGVANLPYTVQANTNLATATWITIGTTNASAGGALQFTDLNAPNFKQRFYRFSYP